MQDKITQAVTLAFYDILPQHDYGIRENQIAMAYQVATALTARKVLLAEAGVGTGKTFAYLVPLLAYARLLNKPVIVTTGTLVLQDQLLGDVQALQRCLKLDLPVYVLKGKENYVCLSKVYTRPPEGLPLSFLAWAETTDTGERQAAPKIPEHMWDKVKVDDSVSCSQCIQKNYCAYVHTRGLVRDAKGPALIVVNHNLFLADLVLRTGDKQGILPDYAAVVADEAHNLEEAAHQAFGRQLDLKSVMGALSLVRHIPGTLMSDSYRLVRDIEAASHRLMRGLAESTKSSDDPDATRFDLRLTQDTSALMSSLSYMLSELQGDLSFAEAIAVDGVASGSRLVKRASDRVASLREALEAAKELKSNIVWLENPLRKAHSLTLRSVPREFSRELNKGLFTVGKPIILTSATLTTQNSWDYILTTLGIPRDCPCWACPSPFKYRRKVQIYVPSKFPIYSADTEDDYYGAVANEVMQLITVSGGRGLVLFTSYRGMNQVYERVREAARVPVLCQDQGPKQELLDQFKTITNSVLFATGSFWEGIDVPGDTLSLLIITKLPFPARDPILHDKCTRAEQHWMEKVLVPEMLLQLRQGAGRLIRHKTDKGVIAVLDRRFLHSDYEASTWAALPSGGRTDNQIDVATFFANMDRLLARRTSRRVQSPERAERLNADTSQSPEG